MKIYVLNLTAIKISLRIQWSPKVLWFIVITGMSMAVLCNDQLNFFQCYLFIVLFYWFFLSIPSIFLQYIPHRQMPHDITYGCKMHLTILYINILSAYKILKEILYKFRNNYQFLYHLSDIHLSSMISCRNRSTGK